MRCTKRDQFTQAEIRSPCFSYRVCITSIPVNGVVIYTFVIVGGDTNPFRVVRKSIWCKNGPNQTCRE